LKSVIITGSSTGIGYATCEIFIKKGFLVFGSVRNKRDSDRLKNSFGTKFIPLIFDITNQKEVFKSKDIIESEMKGMTISALVNNAGIAVTGPISYINPEKIRKQFEVNILGVVNSTQAFLPFLGTDKSNKGKSGKIINISSVAGKIASPFAGPYCMSKFALEALSDSLRQELLIHNIDVIVVGPGPTQSHIWGKEENFELSEYADTEYKDSILQLKKIMNQISERAYPAKKVAELIYKITVKRKPKTRYTITPNKILNWYLPLLIPKRILDRITSYILKIKS